MGKRAYTALHSVAHDGDLPAVRKLLRSGKNPNHFDEGGCTALHCAAEKGHVDVVRELLASGADVNAHDDEVIGDTVLAHVAGNCSLEIASILVAAGADPTIPGWMQLTAIDRAGKRKRGDGPAVYALLQKAAARFG